MNISIDTINSSMTLAGVVLALFAAIIGVVAAMLPKEKAIAAMEQLRAEAGRLLSLAFTVAASVSVAFFYSQRLGLYFIIISATITSVSYLRSKNPTTRMEIFVLIMQVALVIGFWLMYWVSRIVTVLEGMVTVLRDLAK